MGSELLVCIVAFVLAYSMCASVAVRNTSGDYKIHIGKIQTSGSSLSISTSSLFSLATTKMIMDVCCSILTWPSATDFMVVELLKKFERMAFLFGAQDMSGKELTIE